MLLTRLLGVSLLLCGCGGADADAHRGLQGADASEVVTVVLETAWGDIVAEVYPDRAPITAANFLRHVDGRHYDGTSFYRAVRLDNQPAQPFIEVIQGGLGRTVDEEGRSRPAFPPIEHEPTSRSGLRHVHGALSMGRLEVGTASSEFFICINEQPSLDYGGNRNPDGQGFAAFGRVVEGMDVVERIQAAPTDAPASPAGSAVAGQLLTRPVEIIEARRVERVP